jgi:S-adenosylmethionine:tRNA ribosyltransferase-isomerase
MTAESCWNCIIGNQKKWKGEILVKKFKYENITDKLTAEKISIAGELSTIKFRWNSKLSFAQVMDACGKIPIPPYLNRNSQQVDNERYQTIYSKAIGSVAAPTAGLHFTDSVLQKLKSKNVEIEEITLHVGAGTFKPVKTEFANEHTMHSEHFFVKKASIQNIITHTENITAVGTTSVRTLESLYWLGCKILKNNDLQHFHIEQFEPYKNNYIDVKLEEALSAIINYLDKNNINELCATTQIMIMPEYKPKIVSRLITNFHQPKSTLLLLVAAFNGNDWRKIYEYALQNNFRFLSYGDSSIIIPAIRVD